MKPLLEYVEEVLNSLEERSFSEQDVPNIFWLVSNLHYSKHFANKILKGVQGISDSKILVRQFFKDSTTSNVLLVMPGKELVKINQLTRVLYNNPDYLVSNNFATIIRVTDFVVYDIISNIFKNIINSIQYTDYDSQTPAEKFLNWIARYSYNNFMNYYNSWQPKINNVSDLAKFYYKCFQLFEKDFPKDIGASTKEFTSKDLIPLLNQPIVKLVEPYNKEGEWIVKDKTLIVPDNSRMIVGVPFDPEKLSDEQKAIVFSNPTGSTLRSTFGRGNDYTTDGERWLSFDAISKFNEILQYIKQYNLDKVYDLRFVDQRKFQQMVDKINKRQEAQEDYD